MNAIWFCAGIFVGVNLAFIVLAILAATDEETNGIAHRNTSRRLPRDRSS